MYSEAMSHLKPPVIILAAGQSSRMEPLNALGHKSMIELGGRKLLDRSLDSLIEHGFTNLLLVIGPREAKAEYFLNWLKERQASLHSPAILQVAIQEKATGMGDAVLAARAQHPAIFEESEQFNVIGAYTVAPGSVLSRLEAAVADHAIVVTPTPTPQAYGIVEVDPQTRQARSIVEKPDPGTEPSNLKVQLAYRLGKQFMSVLTHIPSSDFSFELALNELMQTEVVAAVTLEESLLTLKYAWHLFDFQEHFLAHLDKTNIHPSAQIAETAVIDDSAGPVVIDELAVVNDFAKISGPAYIGKRSFIGDYSFIRNSTVESQAVIGAKTELVRSIIMPEVSVHYSYVADSIIANRTKVGAGLITANKRHDRGLIKTKVKGSMVETGKKVLGTIIGPDAKIGIAARTMPGVLIPAQAVIEPGSLISKNPAIQST